MTAPLRWLVVLAVAAGLVATPVLLRTWPVEDSDVGAAALADRVRAGADLAWSGEVRTQGALELPESDSGFDGVARLLGESSTLRVWWRSAEEYRVDRVRESGETDLVRSGDLQARWRYEGASLGLARVDDVRLPDDPDVLPASLGRRMLQGASDEELSRLPAERVAGRTALGLRLVPGDERSTLGRVDLWADEDSGLPLRVEVYAEGATAGDDSPVLASEVTSLDLAAPTTAQVRLALTRGADVDVSGERSLAEAALRASPPYVVPDSLVGLERRSEAGVGGAAVYGRGPTALSLVPVTRTVAGELAGQLRRLPGARDAGGRVAVEVGPLSLLVTPALDEDFLLVGTVTPATLRGAADGLGRAVLVAQR